MKRYICVRCQQEHRRCAAHNRAGNPCGRAPAPGQKVCRLHGGASPQAIAAADRRIRLAEASKYAAKFGGSRTVAPEAALLDLVHQQAALVDYWRAITEAIEADGGPDALIWGITREKTGGDDHGTTHEARPNVAYQLLREARRDLADYAAACIKVGIAERQVRLAEQQGALVAAAFRAVFARLDLSPEQWQLVPVVVPEVLRNLTANPEESPA